MFKEIPANKRSLSLRRPVHGVGINDADYFTQIKVGPNKGRCPFYTVWKSMIARCYSDVYHKKQPTYKGCTVCAEWLTFSNFKAWMVKQDWQDNELDKDLINPNNRFYSSYNCVFVSSKLNTLLCDNAARRGEHPPGVSYYKPGKNYRTQVHYDGTNTHVGYFTTINAASKAYIKAKTDLIIRIASQQSDHRIAVGLLLHAELLNQ